MNATEITWWNLNSGLMHRLDMFFISFYFTGKDQLADLWNIVQMLLTISHGQAFVERGYSVNKDIFNISKHGSRVISSTEAGA